MSRFRKFFNAFQRVAMAVVGLFVSEQTAKADACGGGEYMGWAGTYVSCSSCLDLASWLGSDVWSEGWLAASCFQSGQQIMCSDVRPITTGSSTKISDVTYNNVAAGYAYNGAMKYYAAGYAESSIPVVPAVASDCDITGITCTSGYTSDIQNGNASLLASSIVGSSYTAYSAEPIARVPSCCSGTSCFASSLSCLKSDDDAYNAVNPTGFAHGEFETTFGNIGVVHGRAMCSVSSGTAGAVGNPSATLGSYCWCKITSVKDKKGTASTSDDEWLPIYSDWVPSGSGVSGSIWNKVAIGTDSKYSDNYKCLRGCAENCAAMTIGGGSYGQLSTMLNNGATHQLYCKASTPSTVTCSAGQYLPANATLCSSCPAGYYCQGGTWSPSTSIQGRTGVCASGYSTGGASTSTCTPCSTGYSATGSSASNHDSSSDCKANTIYIKWYGVDSSATLNGSSAGLSSCGTGEPTHCKKTSVSYNGNITTPSVGVTLTGASFLGWKFIKN